MNQPTHAPVRFPVPARTPWQVSPHSCHSSWPSRSRAVEACASGFRSSLHVPPAASYGLGGRRRERQPTAVWKIQRKPFPNRTICCRNRRTHQSCINYECIVPPRFRTLHPVWCLDPQHKNLYIYKHTLDHTTPASRTPPQLARHFIDHQDPPFTSPHGDVDPNKAHASGGRARFLQQRCVVIGTIRSRCRPGQTSSSRISPRPTALPRAKGAHGRAAAGESRG